MTMDRRKFVSALPAFAAGPYLGAVLSGCSSEPLTGPGKIVWDRIGMSRNRSGLEQALSDIPSLREEFRTDVRVPGSGTDLNSSLEKAGRVADFFELAELMARDALDREESCGGHFREEHQTDEGEALRDDENYSYVSSWEWGGTPGSAVLHKEELEFENVKLTQRSYK